MNCRQFKIIVNSPRCPAWTEPSRPMGSASSLALNVDSVEAYEYELVH